MTHGLRFIKQIASALRSRAGIAAPRTGKTSLTVICEADTHKRLLREAAEYARARHITEKDIAWGELVAQHMARSLEDAYKAAPLTKAQCQKALS